MQADSSDDVGDDSKEAEKIATNEDLFPENIGGQVVVFETQPRLSQPILSQRRLSQRREKVIPQQVIPQEVIPLEDMESTLESPRLYSRQQFSLLCLLLLLLPDD